MSGRCKACDSILEEWEMKTIDVSTKQYTELCDECASFANDDDDSDLLFVDVDTLTMMD